MNNIDTCIHEHMYKYFHMYLYVYLYVCIKKMSPQVKLSMHSFLDVHIFERLNSILLDWHRRNEVFSMDTSTLSLWREYDPGNTDDFLFFFLKITNMFPNRCNEHKSIHFFFLTLWNMKWHINMMSKKMMKYHFDLLLFYVSFLFIFRIWFYVFRSSII